uniref:Uncharacterized protein n=1 Tax=Parastrongyloides trichosuri TaxID=131310 RepID=A0A0N4ZS80_PARTI
MNNFSYSRSFGHKQNNLHNQVLTSSEPNCYIPSPWRNLGRERIKIKKINERKEIKQKRIKYIKSGGPLISICHLFIVLAMCILTLTDINIFQQEANVEIVNLMVLPNFVKFIMNQTENFGLQIIMSCFFIELTSLYFSKARTNFLDIIGSCLFIIIGYLKFTNSGAVEGIFIELALASMTCVVTFANLVLPKLPKHTTKPNTIMSAFHINSPSSQYSSSICEDSELNEEEIMDVDDDNKTPIEISQPEQKILDRLKFRNISRDDTPIREIRPLLNNFKFDSNNEENNQFKQKQSVFSRNHLISNTKRSEPLFGKNLFTRESYLESKENLYKSAPINKCLSNVGESVNEENYCKIHKLYIYIGVALLVTNTVYNIFSFYQQFKQNW